MTKRKPRHPRCRWCGKRLDSLKHRFTEGYCFIKNEKEIRSRHRPRVKTVAEVYDERGLIRSEFIGTDMEDKLMERQRHRAIDAVLGLGSNGYVIPRNVEFFANQDIVSNQVALKYPWAVYILVTENGRVARKRKRFNNLYSAVVFHRRVHKKYPSSGIVSLGRSYDLPGHYRYNKEKLPKKFKWCPRCGTFRVFKRVHPEEQFWALVKKWDGKKKHYIWVDRKLWLTECQLCGLPNRDPMFRRTNLPWEVRHIKPGVTRVKPRVRTSRGKANRQWKRKTRRTR